jgi:hypothetical protein
MGATGIISIQPFLFCIYTEIPKRFCCLDDGLCVKNWIAKSKNTIKSNVCKISAKIIRSVISYKIVLNNVFKLQ